MNRRGFFSSLVGAAGAASAAASTSPIGKEPTYCCYRCGLGIACNLFEFDRHGAFHAYAEDCAARFSAFIGKRALWRELVVSDINAASFEEHLVESNMKLADRITQADNLLRDVHNNQLNGYLYSGPVAERVAKFVGSPDLYHKGDGLANGSGSVRDLDGPRAKAAHEGSPEHLAANRAAMYLEPAEQAKAYDMYLEKYRERFA